MSNTKRTSKNKLFVVRKLVMARNAAHAIKIEKNHEVVDVWIDDEWKKLNLESDKPIAGF